MEIMGMFWCCAIYWLSKAVLCRLFFAVWFKEVDELGYSGG